ncbi:MAG: restriction endonuclease [Opitutaceae bacterium]
MALLFLLFGLWSSTGHAQIAADIAVGTSVAEVVKRYGWPKSQLSTGGKVIYIYEGFEVTFEDGQATKVMAVAIRPRPSSSSPKPAQKITPAARIEARSGTEVMPRQSTRPATESRQTVNVQSQTIARPTSVQFAQPAKTSVRPASSASPPKPDVFTVFRHLIWFPIIAIAGAVVAKIAIATIGNRSRLTEQLLNMGLSAPSSSLTSELLDRLEWKRFEDLVCLYYRAIGVRAELTGIGADGGVDIKLYAGNAILPTTYVQCKAWGTRDVDVKPIRELFGVMSADQVTEGIFITTGRYTASALEFARSNGIQAISGPDLIAMFSTLPKEQQASILAQITSGDFTTPTCPSCNVKLVLRSEGKFWGCRNYPRCKTKIYARRVR